jgi:ABC-2 type transport system ATP-binding protein
MTPLISLQNIVKQYRTQKALAGVSLDIPPGITGLLGPNGAGKSTLIKLLLGLVSYSAGTGTVLGHSIGQAGRKIRSSVGYMPEDDCYIAGMSGVEVVQFSACLSGLPEVEALRRSHEILDFCGMRQERYRTIETYSTGMRQKIKFAAAIVHDPELLILDEPTSGLDPEERESLLNRIALLHREAGKSVLISTHILPDVQAICTDVVILSKGRVVLQDTLANLNRTTSPSVSFRVLGDHTSIMDQLAHQKLEPRLQPDQSILVESEQPNLATAIWTAASETGSVIRSLIPAKNSLEDIFLQTVQESHRADS